MKNAKIIGLVLAVAITIGHFCGLLSPSKWKERQLLKRICVGANAAQVEKVLNENGFAFRWDSARSKIGVFVGRVESFPFSSDNIIVIVEFDESSNVARVYSKHNYVAL